MRIAEMRDFLVKYMPERFRILLVGAPGIGKTESWMQACDILGWDFIGISMPLEDPSTLRGYPSRGQNGRAVHCLFDGIAKAMDAIKPTLLLADDLGMAQEATLKAWLRFVQFGELDGRKLPECVVIGAATNDTSHGAGVYGLIEPLKSRFHSIVQVETHVEDVIGYGLANNWQPWLLAYLQNTPDAVHDWKPSKSMSVDGACPRGWDYVNRWDVKGCSDTEIWGGAVGKGRATEAHAFKLLQSELPDLREILISPETVSVPENPSARLMVAYGLASLMDGQTFGQCVKYLRRMPRMFEAYSIRGACKAEQEKKTSKKLGDDYRMIASSRDWTAWSSSPEGREIWTAGA